jgi:hypothetical protein
MYDRARLQKLSGGLESAKRRRFWGLLPSVARFELNKTPPVVKHGRPASPRYKQIITAESRKLLSLRPSLVQAWSTHLSNGGDNLHQAGLPPAGTTDPHGTRGVLHQSCVT